MRVRLGVSFVVSLLLSTGMNPVLAQDVGDCVCEMQGRFFNGQFERDDCAHGDCNFGIHEGECILAGKVEEDGTWSEWCNCSLSEGEWPTLCACSGKINSGPLPVLCWTVHACEWWQGCNTAHWWPLPASWVPICQCN